MSKAVLTFKLEDISPSYRALSPEEQRQVRLYLYGRWSRWGRFKVWAADLWSKVW